MGLTRAKDLHTGAPVWTAHPAPMILHEPLFSDQRADVLIIGAGVTGAMLAEELIRAGRSVIILDKRGPLRGSTAATTALMQYDLDLPLIELAKKLGMDKAVRAWRRSKLGLESIAGKLASLGIRCDQVRLPSIYLSGTLLGAEEMRVEQELRNSVGLPVDLLGRARLSEEFGMDRPAALVSQENMMVDPIKMVSAMLNIALSRGAQLFSPVEVTGIESDQNGVHALTEGGPVIHADHVVFATGYELLKYVSLPQHTLKSTYVIATRKQDKSVLPKAMIWEASTPYLYIRTTIDGRVICGGEDEDLADARSRDELLTEKTATLEHKLKAVLDEVDATSEFAWTATFGDSTTGLPLIGAVPGIPNCSAVMGFGGNGMIFSQIATEIISTAITGGSDLDADLFALPK
ncbi:MAG: FAD-binding oxidoreductase [Bacteroidota bacterium]|nr:FAD-binding oxidoreductase [Bacteroidota bacterium]